MEAGGLGPRFYVRLIEVPGGGLLAAIADEEALGRVEEDEDLGVRIEVSTSFYGDRLVDEREARRLLEEADILVLAGSRIIRIAIDSGLVNPDSVLSVGDLQHVQVYKFRF